MTAPTNEHEKTLRDAVTAFYDHLSNGRFAECYRMLDPVVVEPPTGVTAMRYRQSLGALFASLLPPLRVTKFELSVCPSPSRLYGDRPFATGWVEVTDATGGVTVLRERWVLDCGLWHTRCVGYQAPERSAVEAD